MRWLCYVNLEDDLYHRMLTCLEYANSSVKDPGLPNMEVKDFLEVLIEYAVICFEENYFGKEIF